MEFVGCSLKAANDLEKDGGESTVERVLKTQDFDGHHLKTTFLKKSKKCWCYFLKLCKDCNNVC